MREEMEVKWEITTTEVVWINRKTYQPLFRIRATSARTIMDLHLWKVCSDKEVIMVVAQQSIEEDSKVPLHKKLFLTRKEETIRNMAETFRTQRHILLEAETKMATIFHNQLLTIIVGPLTSHLLKEPMPLECSVRNRKEQTALHLETPSTQLHRAALQWRKESTWRIIFNKWDFKLLERVKDKDRTFIHSPSFQRSVTDWVHTLTRLVQETTVQYSEAQEHQTPTVRFTKTTEHLQFMLDKDQQE